MLHIKRSVYVKKKYLFQDKSDTLELEKKNYIFQSKINFIKNMSKFKDSFQAKKLPASDKDDSAFLFTKIKENKQPVAKEKRELKSSVKRIDAMRKDEQSRSQIVSVSQKVRQRLGGRSFEHEGQDSKLAFMFINNAAFRPKFKITGETFQAMKKMNVRLKVDKFGDV